MIINSTNINKTNTHLSHELKLLNMTYDFRNLDPGMKRAQKCGRVKQINAIMGSQLSRLFECESKTTDEYVG